MKTKPIPTIPILFLAILMVLMVLPLSTTAETFDAVAYARELDELNLDMCGRLSEYTIEEPGEYWNFRTAQDETGVWTTYYGAPSVEKGAFTAPSRFVYDNGKDVFWYYGYTHRIIFHGEDAAIVETWGLVPVVLQNVYPGGVPK